VGKKNRNEQKNTNGGLGGRDTPEGVSIGEKNSTARLQGGESETQRKKQQEKEGGIRRGQGGEEPTQEKRARRGEQNGDEKMVAGPTTVLVGKNPRERDKTLTSWFNRDKGRSPECLNRRRGDIPVTKKQGEGKPLSL